ncbi:MAG: bifunctional phosphopantothenoylcysteine decarboxylase/phosphopantothenate--cysteine ligase CoaBC [Chitinophagaceae bacterium]
MLSSKKILIAITGSIAAYKMISLVRLLTKAGAEVKVIMSPAATQFVSPLVLSTLTRNPVMHQLADNEEWSNHVMLGRWADLLLIAPLTCNSLAKMAQGICDNMVMAVYLSATCPVMVAPAMDEDMWLHPSTKRNLAQIKADGCTVLNVDNGSLASGLEGEGRMLEPEVILQHIVMAVGRTNEFAGKRVLITAGPTQEAIDPVRYISNHSSGKMGFALAETIYLQGGHVTLVAGPVNLPLPFPEIQLVKVTTAAEMFDAVKQQYQQADILIMCAAVADYTPETKASFKLKKTTDDFTLHLTKTTDILGFLGANKSSQQVLVGFALETHDELAFAKQKLIAKNADMIVLNSLNDKEAAFGFDTNKITIISQQNGVTAFDLQTKKLVAVNIAASILKEKQA